MYWRDHGIGIGKLLLEKVAEITKQKNKTFSGLFVVGSEGQTDHLMRKLL